jgi:hypothetical protein
VRVAADTDDAEAVTRLVSVRGRLARAGHVSRCPALQCTYRRFERSSESKSERSRIVLKFSWKSLQVDNFSIVLLGRLPLLVALSSNRQAESSISIDRPLEPAAAHRLVRSKPPLIYIPYRYTNHTFVSDVQNQEPRTLTISHQVLTDWCINPNRAFIPD